MLTRREFLAIAGGSLALSACYPATGLAQHLRENTKDRLNVLFLVVDDLRPQFACYGEEQMVSPNIDRLAEEGLLFERAYCQQTLCMPSRASVMSGCRPDTTKVYGVAPLRQSMPDVLTLPEYFKYNGYETVSVGKVYHYPKDDLQGWSTTPFWAKGDGKGRGYLTPEAISRIQEPLQRPWGFLKGAGPAYEAAEVPDNAYRDGKNTDFAIRELQRLKDTRFFLAVGFDKPHLPFNAPQKYWDLYPPGAIDLADNPFPPAGAWRYAVPDFGELRDYVGIPKTGGIPDDLARQLIHGYYACVSYIDAQIGRLLTALEHLELKDKTIIILWGDQGYKLGEHGGWGKHTNFEIDTRVPLIISVPGMNVAGRRTFALTELVDIYPTLCELCGLGVPYHLEGLSLVPVLQDPDRLWKTAAFSQYPRSEHIMGYALRTERYRYVEWQHQGNGKLEAVELYDHRNDPDENVNIAAKPEHAELCHQLSAMLKHGWRGSLPA